MVLKSKVVKSGIALILMCLSCHSFAVGPQTATTSYIPTSNGGCLTCYYLGTQLLNCDTPASKSPCPTTGGGSGSSKTTMMPDSANTVFDPFSVKKSPTARSTTPPSLYTMGMLTPSAPTNADGSINVAGIPPCPDVVSPTSCPDLNTPLSDPTSAANCPPLCIVSRYVSPSDGSEPVTAYSDATCPVQYVQLTTFKQGKALVYKNDAIMPFPIPDMATYNGYVSRHFVCSYYPTIMKGAPSCAGSSKDEGTDAETAARRAEGYKSILATYYHGDLEAAAFNPAFGQTQVGKNVSVLNSGEGYTENTCKTKDPVSPVMFIINVYLSGYGWIQNAAKSKSDAFWMIFTPQYQLMLCKRPAGFYYDPVQTVPTQAVCAHPSMRWYKDGKLVPDADLIKRNSTLPP